MPDLTQLGGGDLGTSPLLAWSAWVGEPGFGGCKGPHEPRVSAVALPPRLLTGLGWLRLWRGGLPVVAGVLA